MTAREIIRRWAVDLPWYAKTALRIRTKSRGMQWLRFNAPQRRLHEALEAWVAEHGRLNALVLKARQMGISTYIAARFFWRLHLAPAGSPQTAMLMAQDDAIAKHQKTMYATFWEHHPAHLRQPRVRSNDHEEAWGNGSRLRAATASTTAGKRGDTIQLLHGTEVAKWAHAEEHTMGAEEQLSKEPGAEMILESTAAGASGPWYERWRAASQPGSGVLPVFLPWTAMPEYAVAPPAGFALSTDRPNDLIPSEFEYAQRHGCTPAQMAFRRREVLRLSQTGADGTLKFAQEFPASPEEAFLSGGESSFLSPQHVEAARIRPATHPDQVQRPLVMAIDPAPQHGRSANAVVWRRGSVCYRIERWRSLAPPAVLARLVEVLQRDQPSILYLDASEGVGHYLETTLPTLAGLGCVVVPVRFGDPSLDPTRYANTRAQIWDAMRQWIARGASIPDEPYRPGQPTLASELLSVQRREESESRLLLEKKAEVIRRLGVSPDGADALAMTFYHPDPDTQSLARPVYTQSPLAGYDPLYGYLDTPHGTAGGVAMGEVLL